MGCLAYEIMFVNEFTAGRLVECMSVPTLIVALLWLSLPLKYDKHAMSRGPPA
uniref:Uncharacterized protein n=1 Tax=Solanum lycopersicum TaxID=4081 RepID=A0A8R6ZBK2_SOLLC